MYKNIQQSLLCLLLYRNVIILGFIALYSLILKGQDSNSKIYKAKYKIVYKQTRLDTHGKIITRKDTVYLQNDTGTIDSLILIIASSKRGLLSNVKFGERGEADKLFVNPYPVYDNKQNSYGEKDIIYYYKLHNRQSIKIKFNHFSLKAISVPLKIRIGRDELDFSTDANLGVLAGYSWGKAKFTHRKKIGNTEIETINTLGVLIGIERLSFTFENENQQRVEEESALISTGLGFVHSYQKFTIGLTGGFDFALGENKTEWDFHARPWFGLAVGYSILSF